MSEPDLKLYISKRGTVGFFPEGTIIPNFRPRDVPEGTDTSLKYTWVSDDFSDIWNVGGRLEVLPPIVPYEVSPAQFRKALNELGLRQAVDEAVAASDKDVQDHWDCATSVQRDYPLLTDLAETMGMTESAIDGVFILAATK